MEDYAGSQGLSSDKQIVSTEELFVYPPKFQKPPEQATNVWLKSIASLALYLILGYYIFHSFEMLLLITAIVVFHELGHFFAMKFYRYKDLGIFFIPLLGAYVSGSKREVSQKESAVILLAGPLPGIILGIILYFLYEYNHDHYIGSISFYTVSVSLIFLNLVNLIPVYPLDGGQLLNRVFLDEESWLSRLFVLLSIAFLSWFALYGMNRPFYPLLIFPAMMLFRMFGDTRLSTIEKKIETAGFDLNVAYEDLPDEDYWKIRNILINEHPSFKDIPTAPPFEYSPKEEKIMLTIQSLLHRNLIQDVSVAGKLIILIIWLAAIASPWLINMDLSFFSRFGF
ncbi:MAG TPA: site-2 protease family protein [Chitinophagaceae bacterium]|nr:site-2 protease family protein [Chitinophagaceae bacterium]